MMMLVMKINLMRLLILMMMVVVVVVIMEVMMVILMIVMMVKRMVVLRMLFLIMLRYYATFKVRKFESFSCKINNVCKKHCNHLRWIAGRANILGKYIEYIFFSFGHGFCGSFSMLFPKAPASCCKKILN